MQTINYMQKQTTFVKLAHILSLHTPPKTQQPEATTPRMEQKHGFLRTSVPKHIVSLEGDMAPNI